MNRFFTANKNYTAIGEKNKKMNNKFIKICKMEQNELKKYLGKELKKYYKNVIAQDGFLYVKGKDKVCLTAHMDTVHDNVIEDYYVYKSEGKTIVSSPQGIGGDDRCGIYMILKILEKTKLRPTIIFCEDEEIGGVGSRKFCNTKFIKNLEKMYCLIELDRKGSEDLVYYSDDNKDFHDYVEEITGYKENYGSFSDISNLSPSCKVSSVNISCGYYNAHTLDEYVVMEEMENSIEKTIDIMKQIIKDKKQFTYKKKEYKPYIPSYRSSYYSDYDYYYPTSWRRSFYGKETEKKEEISMYIQWSKDGEEMDDMIYGETENEIWGKFFLEHMDVCYNDVTDYEVYEDDDLSQYLGEYGKESS